MFEPNKSQWFDLYLPWLASFTSSNIGCYYSVFSDFKQLFIQGDQSSAKFLTSHWMDSIFSCYSTSIMAFFIYRKPNFVDVLMLSGGIKSCPDRFNSTDLINQSVKSNFHYMWLNNVLLTDLLLTIFLIRFFHIFPELNF